MIESLRHVHMLGALCRLAGSGAWTRLMDGERLEDSTDLADVELLLAAGILRHREHRLEPVDAHPWYDDAEMLHATLSAHLERALHYGTQGEDPSHPQPGDVVAMGLASRSVATVLADVVIPMLDGTCDRFRTGRARLLDVGVGTGAIVETLCLAFPGVTATGIDVSCEALDRAKRHLADSPALARLELRQQSVVDLHEQQEYDLAWMPQVFLAPSDLRSGLRRIHRALRPGAWLAMPVAAVDPQAHEFERAVVAHDARRRGGGTLSVSEATTLLHASGFPEVRTVAGVGQTLMLGRATHPA